MMSSKPILAAVLSLSLAALASEEAKLASEESIEVVQDLPRRPEIRRADPSLPFPEPRLPRESIRPERETSSVLEPYLGSIPKEIVVAEGVAERDLERIRGLPNTRLGFMLVNGNTMRPDDLRRLEGFTAVHVYLTAPLEPVHVEVLDRLRTLSMASLRLPAGSPLDDSLAWRLGRLGALRKNLLVEGDVEVDRLAGLLSLRSTTVTVDLPSGGFDEASSALFDSMSSGLRVRIPHTASIASVRQLGERALAGVVLETNENRVSPEVLELVKELDTRVTVVVDHRVGREDLRLLRGVPRLELVVWHVQERRLSSELVELLLESEGIRLRPEPPARE